MKIKMFVERNGCRILRVDDEREDRRVCAGCATYRIDDERAAKSPTTKALIDRQTADQTGRQHRVSRQTLRFFRRKIGQRKAGGRKRVVGGDHPCGVTGDEAIAYPSPDVLRRQFVKIAVERCDAAGECLPIMGCAKGFDGEPVQH